MLRSCLVLNIWAPPQLAGSARIFATTPAHGVSSHFCRDPRAGSRQPFLMASPTFKPPKHLQSILAPLESFALDDPRSGWRERQPDREEELVAVFLGGGWGLHVGDDAVHVLELTTENGLRIVDDGMSTLRALIKCQEHRNDDSAATPDGKPWPENVLALLEKRNSGQGTEVRKQGGPSFAPSLECSEARLRFQHGPLVNPVPSVEGRRIYARPSG